MTNYRTAITILGGGPAGSTTSLFLSRYGIPHLLIDQHRFPRHKVCGESFDGRVTHVLNALSPDYLPELSEKGLLQRSWRYSLHTERLHLPIQFPHQQTPRLLSNRFDFDHFLWEKARASETATVLEGHKVRRLEQTASGWQLDAGDLQVSSRLLVLAAGSHSPFSPKDPKDPKVFLFARAYYRGIQLLPDEEVEIYYFKQPLRGCLILCPLPGGLCNVEIGFEKKSYQKSRLPLTAILDGYLNQNAALGQRFARAAIDQKLQGTYLHLIGQRAVFSAPGLLRVGASALSVNPVTGMGVGNAMTMARVAAQQIQAHWQEGQLSAGLEEAYALEVRKRLQPILRFNALLNAFQYKIHFLEPVLLPLLRTRWMQKLLHEPNWAAQVHNPRFYWELMRRS